jgi:preprotein translocase subunit SecF
MKCSIIKKAKFFFIGALVIIVAGLSLFGFLGFNQTIDYKGGYDLKVGVKIEADGVVEIINDTTAKYFAEKGIKPVASQVIENGLETIYKFNNDVEELTVDLEKTIQDAIDADGSITNVFAEVEFKQSFARDNTDMVKVILAVGIALVVMFVYALIVEKLAGAVSIACSTLLSALMFVALMGITRIPAAPFFAIGLATSTILAGAMSFVTANKYRTEYNKADKPNKIDIVNNVAKKASKLYIIVAGAILLTSIALVAFALPYVMIAGAQVAVAGICGISSAVFCTPIMWTLIKNKKK